MRTFEHFRDGNARPGRHKISHHKRKSKEEKKLQLISVALNYVLARVQDLREESGQTLVEYGLIIALISIAIIGIMFALGEAVGITFQTVVDCFGDLPACGAGPAPATP
jgi:pilus assembly protein Flp/PilA